MSPACDLGSLTQTALYMDLGDRAGEKVPFTDHERSLRKPQNDGKSAKSRTCARSDGYSAILHNDNQAGS